MTNLRTRLQKLEEAVSPPASTNPLHNLAARMRARLLNPTEPTTRDPRPGSLAWRMRRRVAP